MNLLSTWTLWRNVYMFTFEPLVPFKPCLIYSKMFSFLTVMILLHWWLDHSKPGWSFSVYHYKIGHTFSFYSLIVFLVAYKMFQALACYLNAKFLITRVDLQYNFAKNIILFKFPNIEHHQSMFSLHWFCYRFTYNILWVQFVLW